MSSNLVFLPERENAFMKVLQNCNQTGTLPAPIIRIGLSFAC